MTFVHVRRNMPGRPYFRKTLKVLESKISVLEDLFGKTEKHIKKAGLMVNKKEESLKQWTHQADHQLVLFNDAIKTARQIKEEILHLHAQLSPMVALQAQQVQQLQQIQQVQQGQGIPPSQMTSPPPSASTSASVTASPPPHPQPSFHLNHLNQLPIKMPIKMPIKTPIKMPIIHPHHLFPLLAVRSLHPADNSPPHQTPLMKNFLRIILPTEN